MVFERTTGAYEQLNKKERVICELKWILRNLLLGVLI